MNQDKNIIRLCNNFFLIAWLSSFYPWIWFNITDGTLNALLWTFLHSLPLHVHITTKKMDHHYWVTIQVLCQQDEASQDVILLCLIRAKYTSGTYDRQVWSCRETMINGVPLKIFNTNLIQCNMNSLTWY